MPADIPGGLMIRAYLDGDERAILGLFHRYFPHAPRSLEHFRWKFRENPFGNERISLAFAGAQLVGHYAGYAVPFRLFDGEGLNRGRDLIANQIGDTMTDQSVRHIGRGPTSVLGRAALHFYSISAKAAWPSHAQRGQHRVLAAVSAQRPRRVVPIVCGALPPITRSERGCAATRSSSCRRRGRSSMNCSIALPCVSVLREA